MRSVFSLVAALAASVILPCAGTAETQSHGNAISAAIRPGSLLRNAAAVEASSRWESDFLAGQTALHKFKYAEAERRFLSAWEQLRKRNNHDARLFKTRLCLADAELGLRKFDSAERNYLMVLTGARQMFGPASDEYLRALNGATRVSLELDKLQRAAQFNAQALSVASQMPKSNRDACIAEANNGAVLLKQGALGEANSVLSKTLSIIESLGGNNDDLLQGVLYDLALSFARQGESEKAEPYFAKAFALKEQSVVYDRPFKQAGIVTMRWEDGSPRARQMWDPEYPLKYMHLKNVRVATTIVRSENLVSVLISIANCGRERVQIGVGDVRLQSLSPAKKDLVWIDGNILDRVLEEDHVNNLTWRRVWLSHIQKTRRIPGFLKDGALNTDNFLGNNVFGPYGHWPVMAFTEPAVVTREQFYDDIALEAVVPGDVPKPIAAFANNSGSALRPTFLEPGDARTGVVYFQRERFDAARLHINLGNVIFEFPFSAPGGPGNKH